MTILRVAESVLQPGALPRYIEVGAKVKPLIDAAGAQLNFMVVNAGGDPNTVLAVAGFEDLPAYASASANITSNSQIQAALGEYAGVSMSSLDVTLYNDISEELGGGVKPVENPLFFSTYRMKIQPGKRDHYISAIRQIREARLAAGLPVSATFESLIGESGVVIRSRGYASLDAFAEEASKPQPSSVVEIFEKMAEDPAFPYFENQGSRLLANITGQL